MTKRYDTILIGGGSFGLFASLALRKAGNTVLLLDRGPVWSEASAVNAGSLGIQNKLPALVPYTLWALDIWRELAQKLGMSLDLHRTGGYKVALSTSDLAQLEMTAREQNVKGLVVERLKGKTLRERAPWLSPEILVADFCEEDSYVSPTRLGPALRATAIGAGVEIVEHAEVRMIDPNDLSVNTTMGQFHGGSIGITSGAWSGQVASLLGVCLPMELDVNMVSVTEPAPPTVPCIVTHARGILTLKQVSNGSCLIGGGWQGIGTLTDRRKEVDYDQLTHNLRLAARVVPNLASLNVLRSWAGYEGVTPDSLPYLGRLPGHSDIYVAACARGGFTMGPLLGQLLGELISTGSTSRPIELFNPERF